LLIHMQTVAFYQTDHGLSKGSGYTGRLHSAITGLMFEAIEKFTSSTASNHQLFSEMELESTTHPSRSCVSFAFSSNGPER